MAHRMDGHLLAISKTKEKARGFLLGHEVAPSALRTAKGRLTSSAASWPRSSGFSSGNRSSCRPAMVTSWSRSPREGRRGRGLGPAATGTPGPCSDSLGGRRGQRKPGLGQGHRGPHRPIQPRNPGSQAQAQHGASPGQQGSVCKTHLLGSGKVIVLFGLKS